MGSWPALKDRNILFLDTETGGLSAANRDIVEVACILTDPSGRKVLEEWEAKVIPTRPVEEEAARINGYDREKWAAEGVTLSFAMIKVLTMANQATMCCHNAPFDKGFVEAALALVNQKWTGSYHTLCTMALAMPLLQAGVVPDLKLPTLSRHFGLPMDNQHRAMGDAKRCYGVYLALQDIYAPAVAKYAQRF